METYPENFSIDLHEYLPFNLVDFRNFLKSTHLDLFLLHLLCDIIN